MSKQREIDQLLEDILVDAYGEDEQLWAFRQTFEDEVPLTQKVCATFSCDKWRFLAAVRKVTEFQP
jgi:hypothetical protein